jgi:hypothetical protein
MEEKRPLVIEQRGDLHVLLIRVSVVRLKTTFFGQLHAPHMATSLGHSGGSLLFSNVEHEVRVCGNVHFY